MAMSGPEGSSAAPLSAIRRYFEISLYLLLLTSVLTLVATGKLDLVSGMASSAALLVKGYRWSRGCRPELSHRAATWLVASYFVFFPIDLWGFSRALAAGAPSPALYAALLAAIHLTLFAMVVRLYSASTTRSEEHTSEPQSRLHLVCRLLLEKKKNTDTDNSTASSYG